MTTTSKELEMTTRDLTFAAIYSEAVAKAIVAGRQYVAQYGEDMYCGFGWVEIPNGRSPFVNWCKKNGVGSKHWKKGWQIWRPTGNCTQSMTVLEIEAQAFADVLTSHGIEAWMGSRAD
jgi:hypothetical protein